MGPCLATVAPLATAEKGKELECLKGEGELFETCQHPKKRRISSFAMNKEFRYTFQGDVAVVVIVQVVVFVRS
jgi:hypothetical protein